MALGEWSPEQILDLAKKELNEDDERREKDVEAVREWLQKQAHLSHIDIDDPYILAFLRGCKFSLERTKEKLDLFYSVKNACPEFFDDWNPKSEMNQYLLSTGFHVPLKGFDKHGRRVVLIRFRGLDPDKCTMGDHVRIGLMLVNLNLRLMQQDIVTGMVVVQDLSGTSLAQTAIIAPVVMKKAMTIFQDALPLRPKEMHFLNMPSLFESVFSLMKSMAKDKLKDRMIVHPKDDFSGLEEYLGKEILPEEYGGTNGKLQEHHDKFKADLESRQTWLQNESKKRSDEGRRVGKPKDYNDIFGMEGSFRKLNID